MNSSDSQSIPFRCRKPLLSKPKPEMSNQLTSKTPEKQPSKLPRRAANSRVALSLKEVRVAAQSRPQQRPTHQIESAGEQFPPSPSDECPAKSARESIKLPEKYRQLGEIFDSLDGVIRLLKLKCSLPTFTNIYPKIECLTDRRFSYGHLAQIKFILPEAIEIRKVLTFDEKTSCMKPDLHITINVDAVECDGKLKSGSKNLNLRKVFRARLVDYLKDHPQVNEIPEEILPEPFNNSKSNMIKSSTSLTSSHSSTDASLEQQSLPATSPNYKLLNIIRSPSMSMVMGTSASASDNQQTIAASHYAFRRHFSQKPVKSEAEKNKAEKKLSDLSDEPSVVPSSSEETSYAAASSPIRLSSKSTSRGKCLTYCVSPTRFAPSCIPATPVPTPVKEIEPTENKEVISSEVASVQSTPVKLVSTPVRLMTATPTLQPPKRCYMTPENVTASSPNKLTRRPPRSRSLKFDTPVKSEKVEHEVDEMKGILDDDHILDILPDNLLQSIRKKERKAMEERDPAISQAKRRRQMIACLPKLFNMIHFLFQSIQRSVITKEELIYKIISSHLLIVDRREVEEQLNLLLELVPDWISEKLSSCGDLLVCINKMSSPESIRALLENPK